MLLEITFCINACLWVKSGVELAWLYLDLLLWPLVWALPIFSLQVLICGLHPFYSLARRWWTKNALVDIVLDIKDSYYTKLVETINPTDDDVGLHWLSQLMMSALIVSQWTRSSDWLTNYITCRVCCSWLGEVLGRRGVIYIVYSREIQPIRRRLTTHILLGLHCIWLFCESLGRIASSSSLFVFLIYVILQEGVGLPLLTRARPDRTGPYGQLEYLHTSLPHWFYLGAELGLATTVIMKEFLLSNALALLGTFTNVTLPMFMITHHLVYKLTEGRLFDSRFQHVSHAELTSHGDVCAVCLIPMTAARRTPCGHFFHEACLKLSIFTRNKCPMCNTAIPFSCHAALPPLPYIQGL